jgi:CheY-like chemotaxis protein
MLEGVHILLVEDDADTIEMYLYGLARFGAKVTAATSVQEAFDLFRREPPDVLVSDISLDGGEDGYELVRAVRALGPDVGGDVPAVALTGWARGQDADRALAAGFTSHHHKPCMPDELAEILALQVHAARQLRARSAGQRIEQRQLRSALQERMRELRNQRDRLDAQWSRPTENE